MSSLAASTPSTCPPAAVKAPLKAGAAFWTSQPLTTASWTIWALLLSSTSWAPFLNRTALLSTSVPPSIMMIFGLVIPWALRQSSSDCPWSLPTSSLSNDT